MSTGSIRPRAAFRGLQGAKYETGRKPAVARLPEGVGGIAKLPELLVKHGGTGLDPAGVVVDIETDRGSWVQALIASGYQVCAINPRQVASRRSPAPRCSPSSETTPTRYASAKARKNYAGTGPVTRASGKSHTVQAATSATTASPTPSSARHPLPSTLHPAPAATTTAHN
ncbi:hypothetical protein SAMN05216489_01679 [Streptomyces sp. 3213]|nr:hypothetical protein SAMN05216489_01679 [Streptomyces sp. 3213] [Streptomyces sp. 3213.3]